MANPNAKATVTGDRELDKMLGEFEPSIQKKGSARATREAAKTVSNRARNYAPVDTGELESSIKVRAFKRSRRYTSGHGVSMGAMFKNSIAPYYASFVEFGTKLRRHKSTGKRVGRIVGDSYLRAALWDSESDTRATFIRVFKQWLREYAAKASAKAKKQ